MKTAKIFFDEPDYYVHGTGDLGSLGEEASHGCLRMKPDEVAELARTLMEHEGESRPAGWYERIRASDSTEEVVLDGAVPMRIRG